MTIADQTKLMTEEEFLDLPDDGVERWLINGELREDETGRTYRNARHAQLTAAIAHKLLHWLSSQPMPRGIVGNGEMGFRLQGKPTTLVGADVAYVDAETSKSHTPRGMIKGSPVLAVEIISPSDRTERIEEKVEAYLAAGTQIVWVVYPRSKTITVYRNDRKPELFNDTQAIDAEPYLPGFRLPLIELFGA